MILDSNTDCEAEENGANLNEQLEQSNLITRRHYLSEEEQIDDNLCLQQQEMADAQYLELVATEIPAGN